MGNQIDEADRQFADFDENFDAWSARNYLVVGENKLV